MVEDSEDSPIKLVDFGLSKMLGPSDTASDPYGTLAYVAPEVLMQKPYRFSGDIWSLGIIIYVMLSGMLPFDSDQNKETARQTVHEPVPFRHKLWDYVSRDAKDLIVKLLTKDQRDRISLAEVLIHPWICKRNMEILQIRQRL